MSTEVKNIFLIGMMASGKTTVGKLLAKKLGWTFVDVDREVEKRSGVSISLIFEKEGEAGFRSRETRMMQELAGRSRTVISTGGGAPLFKANQDILKSGLVLHLVVTAEDVIERTCNDTSRPLLQGEDFEDKVRKILTQRQPVYEGVRDVAVLASEKSPQMILDKILELNQVKELI